MLVTIFAATPFSQASNTAINILVLGDSLSAGYGLEAGKGWVDLLRESVCSEVTGCQVINASISGDTTGGGRARLASLLDQHQPDVLIVELGGNDGLRGYPLESIRLNLATIIETGLAGHAQVLLVGMRIPPNYGRRYTEGFHGLFHALATKYKAPLVPFLLDGIATERELMQDDGIHPKAEAQALMLHNVLPHLAALLPVPESP